MVCEVYEVGRSRARRKQSGSGVFAASQARAKLLRETSCFILFSVWTPPRAVGVASLCQLSEIPAGSQKICQKIRRILERPVGKSRRFSEDLPRNPAVPRTVPKNPPGLPKICLETRQLVERQAFMRCGLPELSYLCAPNPEKPCSRPDSQAGTSPR